VPVLVVSGDHDLDAFPTRRGALARTLPRGQLRTLPWAGHLPTLGRPDEVGQLMNDFLAD
jgi:pimeloyl-ACP methyl ester carboxylesterase